MTRNANQHLQRMEALKGLVLFIGAAVFIIAAAWWLATPRTFEECVQKYVKNARTPTGAQILTESCHKQFPPGG